MVKGGWSAIALRAGIGQAEGRAGPAHRHRAFTSGATTGKLSRRGPRRGSPRAARATSSTASGSRPSSSQGTADTLFTLDEAITNYRILAGNSVPTKMLWFCGGHGVCLTEPGDAASIERGASPGSSATSRGRRGRHGPELRVARPDDAKWRSAADYPLKPPTPLAGTGTGTLPLVNGGGSGPVVPPPTAGEIGAA